MIQSKERASNIELLRIISMLLIVMSHCDDIFGLYDLYSRNLGAKKILVDCLNGGGQVGVGCFLLISGYYLLDRKTKFDLKKYFLFLGQVWFYSICCYIIMLISCVIRNTLEISVIFREAWYAFFPIISAHYWFASVYFLILLFLPFIDKLLTSFTHSEYRKFLYLLFIVFSVVIGVIPHGLYGINNGRLMPCLLMFF